MNENAHFEAVEKLQMTSGHVMRHFTSLEKQVQIYGT